jgi:hypothetical protein
LRARARGDDEAVALEVERRLGAQR